GGEFNRPGGEALGRLEVEDVFGVAGGVDVAAAAGLIGTDALAAEFRFGSGGISEPSETTNREGLRMWCSIAATLAGCSGNLKFRYIWETIVAFVFLNASPGERTSEGSKTGWLLGRPLETGSKASTQSRTKLVKL